MGLSQSERGVRGFWYFVDGLDAENVHEDENASRPRFDAGP